MVREEQPAELAWRAPRPRASPSAAETIEPFMRMCHWRANASGSSMPASSARSRDERADVGEVADRGLRGPGSGSSISSITLMNEQPSKPSWLNQPANVSKIASRRSAGVSRGAAPRPAARRASSAPRARSRNARIRSSFEGKLR